MCISYKVKIKKKLLQILNSMEQKTLQSICRIVQKQKLHVPVVWWERYSKYLKNSFHDIITATFKIGKIKMTMVLYRKKKIILRFMFVTVKLKILEVRIPFIFRVAVSSLGVHWRFTMYSLGRFWSLLSIHHKHGYFFKIYKIVIELKLVFQSKFFNLKNCKLQSI